MRLIVMKYLLSMMLILCLLGAGEIVPVNLEKLDRFSQSNPSFAVQESVRYKSAQILSSDGVRQHSDVDKIEKTDGLTTIDLLGRSEFEKCGIEPKPGHFYYQVDIGMGIENSGVPPRCLELTKEKAQSVISKARCEKRSWFGICFNYCSDEREAFFIFETKSNCEQKLREYIENEG